VGDSGVVYVYYLVDVIVVGRHPLFALGEPRIWRLHSKFEISNVTIELSENNTNNARQDRATNKICLEKAMQVDTYTYEARKKQKLPDQSRDVRTVLLIGIITAGRDRARLDERSTGARQEGHGNREIPSSKAAHTRRNAAIFLCSGISACAPGWR
jgi:hypothetical protein